MKKSILTLLITATAQGLWAQEAPKELPGKTELVSSTATLLDLAKEETGSYDYTVEDFFKKPKQQSFILSPDGTYMSYRERDNNGKNHVYVKHTETGKIIQAIKETESLIAGYFWINENRLAYFKDNHGNENYHVFSVDLDGSNDIELTPYPGVRAMILNDLKDQKDFAIVLMNKANPSIFEPYKLNVNTGEIELIYENKDFKNPIVSFNFDKDGVLRAYTKQEGTDTQLFYRTSTNNPFEKVIQLNWKKNFELIDFDYSGKYPHAAYFISTLESNTNAVVLYDLVEKKVIKQLYNHPTFDITYISRSRKRNYEIDYYNYADDKIRKVPISETYKKFHERVISAFPNYEYNVASITDNEDRLLIHLNSDKQYGKYYMYDVTTDTFNELIDLNPELKEKDMAEMRPIKFKSRDGLDLYGYITVPKNIKGKKVPLIVNPHGGPYGPRDHWGFNPETQLFASRGYATLQVNFRGSGGYGKEFWSAGFKQIGRKMLDDLEDGVAYAKTLGFVDEKRVAIYGASYGGWATLGGLVKTPDLYTCGVDYVGVSNAFTILASIPAYWKPYLDMMKEQIYDDSIPEEKEIMTQISPALNADKIKKPVFVVQGANDPRVNINEADQIVENLRQRGFDVPYMVKYNEGHGFRHEENQIEFYKTMMGFWAKHLK